MDTLPEFSKLKAAFGSLETADEFLNAFHKMEKSGTFDERDLGLASVLVGFKLHGEGKDPHKALTFATRALKSLDTDRKEPSFPVANALFLVGSIHYMQNKFSDSLGYLKRANTIMGRLKDEGLDVDSVWGVFHGLYLMLAQAHWALENYKEALPFGLKAVELREKWWPEPYSMDVAHDWNVLADIYSGLGEHEKASEQHLLAIRILKHKNVNSDLLRLEISEAKSMIKMGYYDEAMKTLRNVVDQTDVNSETRALAFIAMGKVLCDEEMFEEWKKILDISLFILAKREKISPVEVADAYSEVWELYETMNEIENAISLLKRALALLEKIPKEQHRQGLICARIGTLLVRSDKEQQAIPYFEKAVERLKCSFGPKHFKVGAMYNNLGASYMELDRPEKAAEMFEIAKDIMVASLGPHHEMTIGTCENLSNAHEKMGRGLCMFHAVQRALAKELSKIYVVATSRHPPVKWAQRSDELYITVELPDAQDVKFRLEPEGKFYFSATAGAEKIPYEVNFNLFDKVDVNNSKASVGSRNIFYLVKKAKSKWWDRLLKQRGKPPVFLKVDWDKWVDEDEEQEADKHGFDMDLSDMDFSKFNMVGGEGPDDDNDDDDESEVTGEASADNEPDSKRRRGSRS